MVQISGDNTKPFWSMCPVRVTKIQKNGGSEKN